MSENVLKFPGAASTKPPVEVYAEVKTYVANVQCAECTVGYMIALPVEQMLLQVRALGNNDYAKVPHACNQCGHQQSYTERFPLLRYFNLGEGPDQPL